MAEDPIDEKSPLAALLAKVDEPQNQHSKEGTLKTSPEDQNQDDDEEEEDSDNDSLDPFNLKASKLYGGLLPPAAFVAGNAEVSVTSFSLGMLSGACLLLFAFLLTHVIPTLSMTLDSPAAVPAYISRLPAVVPWQLPAYGAVLGAFHFLEYWTTAAYNPEKVSTGSFLLRNGAAYTIVHLVALSETLLERYVFTFLPASLRLLTMAPASSAAWKSPRFAFFVSLAGLAITIAGQLLRSAAMIHASSNFSHSIARSRDKSHKLVTSGVYTLSRHPSYAGFFLWALGTQILLLNPVSIVLFLVLLWKFFSERIKDEEIYLVAFFGNDYIEYRKKTPTLIPFIK